MSIYKQIFTYRKQLFPNPKTELNYKTRFQLVIAVILSAQTTDKQVNKVTEKLFKIIETPQDLLLLGRIKLQKSINSINIYKNKSKYLRELSEWLNNNGNKLPKSIEDMKKLPGIGEKTAKVIAHVLFDAPVIAVDTHVHRVYNRLGIVSTKNPLQTSKLLENLIPKQYKSIAHHTTILFGRYYCKARNPRCSECQLKSICKYYKTNFNH